MSGRTPFNALSRAPFTENKLSETWDGHSKLYFYVTSARRKSLPVRGGDQPFFVFETDNRRWVYWDGYRWLALLADDPDANPVLPDNLIMADIDPSTFEYVDTTPLSAFHAIEYFITVWSGSKTNTRKLSTAKILSGTVETVYGISGDKVLFLIDVLVIGSDLKLKVTNNESLILHFEAEKNILE